MTTNKIRIRTDELIASYEQIHKNGFRDDGTTYSYTKLSYIAREGYKIHKHIEADKEAYKRLIEYLDMKADEDMVYVYY